MTIKECYDSIGGDYEDLSRRLRTQEQQKKFLAMFLRDDNYNLLLKAMEEKDYNLAFQAAHTIKGVSMNLGLTSLAVASSKLTEELRAREENPRILIELEKTKEVFQLTVQQLSKLL